MPAFHALPSQDALERLGASAHGLAEDEAARRLEQHGRNALPEQAGRSAARRLADQFRDLLIRVLIAAALVTAMLGHWLDTAVIAAVVLVNAIIGFVQEGKAERALNAIRGMLAPWASVMRGGHRRSIAAAELVPGDIVVLEAGDRVPADLRLRKRATCASMKRRSPGPLPAAPRSKRHAPMP